MRGDEDEFDAAARDGFYRWLWISLGFIGSIALLASGWKP